MIYVSLESDQVQMESSEVVEGQASSLTSSATSDSDTSSLVETWTLVDKEEAKHVRNNENEKQ